MNPGELEQVVNAVLYEGYLLYPYRPSSNKNQRERFTFGRVYPEAYSRSQQGAEPCVQQTECLLATGCGKAKLHVSVRFLQPVAREIGALEEAWTEGASEAPRWRVVPELRVGEELLRPWHEAVEHSVESGWIDLGSPSAHPMVVPFQFPALDQLEPLVQNRQRVGVVRKRQAAVEGLLEITTQPLQSSLTKITVRILNQTPVPAEEIGPDRVLVRTLTSTLAVLRARAAEFISLLDPPEEYRPAAQSCQNVGAWPVLVGDEAQGERVTMLSSPIILYDYPKIAPESPGPLFDGTEIDEILSLRILTLTDEEKIEMRTVDEQARRLLQRTEALNQDEFWKMHGTFRQSSPGAPVEFDDFFGATKPLEGTAVGGVFLRVGDRVRVRPKARADVMDLALSGRIAVVEAVEQDVEGRIHFAVVFDDDPGKDLGLRRQPGHRFFYGVEEVEPVRKGAP